MGFTREELLDAKYWEDRYHGNQIGWDIGYPSTPLQAYFDQLTDKNLNILIPGAGNAYEAQYLFENGFKNVSVVDLAPSALKNLKSRVPEFPDKQLIEGDFFNLSGQYDLIVEQTFFCALHPELRQDYAKHMHQLLAPNGKLMGVLFDDALNTEHPPYGGNKSEYLNYFEPFFEIATFEKAFNSIKPRQGKELFILLRKK
jgi:SAM-dependent methyltransferase